MPSIKIYPPTPLPDRKVNETQFNIWTEEIEVYLSQENDFSLFLPGALYANWTSFEANNLRIAALVPADRVIAGDNVNAEQAAAQNMGAYSKFFGSRWGRKDKDVFFGEIRNFDHID